jgi:hypothetical protein
MAARMNTSILTPSADEIASIIRIDGDPVIRNLKITQCYHDLSRAITSVIGGENVNWCTFATWASKTAGRFIRGELLAIFRDALQSDRRLAAKLDRINELLRRVDATVGFGRLAVIEAIHAPVAEVSQHITVGNLAVFAELGPLFSVLCARFGEDAAYDGGTIARVVDELELKSGPPEQGGQSLLRDAVGGYYQAKFEVQADRKAELILLANAQTGLHEQVRLQPAIAASLQLPFDAALRVLFDRGLGGRYSENLHKRLRVILAGEIEPVLAEANDALNRVWRECVTRVFMTLRLPDGEIHLGKDLRPLPGQTLFPLALRSIADPDLLALLTEYRVDGMTARASGAVDWVDIAERMQFILTLFRARQQDLRLFEQPFADAQQSDIANGRLPQGPL